jgi:hypothetical protein
VLASDALLVRSKHAASTAFTANLVGPLARPVMAEANARTFQVLTALKI